MSVPAAWQVRTEGAISGPDAAVPGPRAAWFARQHFWVRTELFEESDEGEVGGLFLLSLRGDH